ncbi:MAG TPA: hypothetical protein VGK59_19685 [Ohtaekwangia sp.]
MIKFIKSTSAFCFTLLLFTGLNAYGQDPKTPEQRATAITEWMKTNLQLTPEQEGPVQTINLKYANLNEGLKTSSKARMAKAKELKTNNESKKKELKEILTPEQFKMYEAKEAELKEKFKEEAQKRKG